jgi:formate dehydrogenase subunit gamma
VLLALSGLALFHPAMFWLTALFGGGQWTRILHPFIGVVIVRAIRGAALLASQRARRGRSAMAAQIGDVVNNREDGCRGRRTTPDRSCCSSRWWLACCCSCCPAS